LDDNCWNATTSGTIYTREAEMGSAVLGDTTEKENDCIELNIVSTRDRIEAKVNTGVAKPVSLKVD
jgi:hypothetical protein